MEPRPSIPNLPLLSLMLLVGAPLTGPPEARAGSGTVVISQAYAGGGESGAAFQNDYIVLFNNGTASIDVSSWSLQVGVSGPVGPMWEVISLCGSIPHGRFYLVALGSGGPSGGLLPATDCTGTTNLPPDTGKIALVSATSALAGTCPLTDATVVDFLGYGSGVGCSEGSPAGSPDPTTALFRSSAGPCQDTDDNSADFVLSTPSPQNTASPGNGCNNASPTVASIPAQSADEQATLVVTPSGSDPNGDPLLWSGSNLPSGSGVAPTTGVFTWTAGSADAGLYTGVTLTADDGLGGSGSASFDITVVDVTTPVVDPIADQAVAEGSSLTVLASAGDADGDPLTFSYSPPLSWITQTPMTSEFTFAPGYDVTGLGGSSFGITVEASDGTNTAAASFTVYVVNITTAASTPHAAMTWPGVSAATRELSFVEDPDLCLGGPRPLCFQRYYASLLDREGEAQGAMGANWLGSYDWRLVETATEVKVVDPRGRVYRFASGVGGAWTLVEPQDAPHELTDLGTVFSFAHARHRMFYIIDRTTARLARIEDGLGNVHTLGYVGGDLSSVSDGLGRTLTFAHDGSGRVTSVTDGTRTVTYGYTGQNLTSVTDAESKTTTYQYDLAHSMPGLLTAVVDASGGDPLQYQHDGEGRVSQVQLGSADIMTLQQTMLSSSATQTEVQWPDGGVHHYTHDSSGQLTQYADPQGGVTTASYDIKGRLISYSRPSTITPLTIGYDPVSGFPSTLTLPDANEWQIGYVDRSFPEGRLYFSSSIHAPDLGQVTYSYDGVGNLTQTTDQASHSWTMTHNSFGQPLTITNPTSGAIAYTYDSQGRLTSSYDGAGTTQFGHDALDRLTTITHPDASTQTFTWNGRNQLLTTTDELSKTWTYAYRDNGQLLSITDPLLATTTLGYDARNRLTQVTDALSGVTGIGYDPSWRVSSVTDPTSRAVTYQHDLLGRPTGITDPGGETTTYGYDADSRLTSVTDPLTHTWSYGYNNRDQLTSATDPLTNTTTYGHDPMGRVTAIDRPLGLNTTYTYDLRGLLTGATTGPVSVGYSYTPLGQLDTFTDGESNAWTRTYDPQGRLAAVTDPHLRSASFSYDDRNRVTGYTHPEGSATFVFDVASRLTQRSYSDGTVHNYTYDDVGRLLTTEGVTRTYDLLGRITEENGILYGYDAAGRLETETYSAGHEVGHNFGLRGLPSQTTDWLSGVTTYTFDAAGRLTELARPNGTSTRYEYDNVGRVLGMKEVTTTDTIGSVQLTRDALGRVTSADRKMSLPWAPETTSRTYSYDAASQVVGFTYDGSGRLLDDGTRTYAWDGASRADSISEGSTTTRYTSDGLNRVVGVGPAGGDDILLVPAAGLSRDIYGREITSPDVQTRHDPFGRVVAEFQVRRGNDAPSKIVRRRSSPSSPYTDRTHWITTPWGAPLHRIDLSGVTPTRRYYHFDEAGNTSFLTGTGGSVVASYAYSPTGEATALGENQPYPALTYGGQLGVVEEASSGLYRAGGFFYDALTAQSSPAHGSCGCKEKFDRSKPHLAPLPSPTTPGHVIRPSGGGTGVPIIALLPEDQPEKLSLGGAGHDASGRDDGRLQQIPALFPDEKPEKLTVGGAGFAASPGERVMMPQFGARPSLAGLILPDYTGETSANHNRGKLLVGVDDVSLRHGDELVIIATPPPDDGLPEMWETTSSLGMFSRPGLGAGAGAGRLDFLRLLDVSPRPSASQANRRYLYFAKVAALAGGRGTFSASVISSPLGALSRRRPDTKASITQNLK